MSAINDPIFRKKNDRPLLLVFCLLVSILLHLFFVFLLPYEQLRTSKTIENQEKPTIVRLVDKRNLLQQPDYEIDQKPSQPEQDPSEETNRLAEKSQRVEKEQAPKGEDDRDQAKRQRTATPPPQPQQQKSAAEKQQSPASAERQRPSSKRGQLNPQEELPPAKASAPSEPNYPSLQQLTQLTPSTLDRSIQSGRSEREKIKQRNDLSHGDTVWLNLKRGDLISFFRRFHNQIEGVWNYPPEAAQQGIEGVLLLKITVSRAGELLDAELLNTSGSDILDYEAIQAVYRAAPFGPLPKHYPYPDLKIHAHFLYQISGRYIYGQP